MQYVNVKQLMTNAICGKMPNEDFYQPSKRLQYFLTALNKPKIMGLFDSTMPQERNTDIWLKSAILKPQSGNYALL